MLLGCVVSVVVGACTREHARLTETRLPNQPVVQEAAVAQAGMEPPPKILPETYFAAGRLLEQQSALPQAAVQYRLAVAANHKYAEAYQRLAVVTSKLGRHEEAVEMLQRALDLRPNDPYLRNDLGFELALLERFTAAEAELRQALVLKPDFPRAAVNLGMVLCRQQRFAEGLLTFRSVLPEADAYYNLGLLQRGQQHYSEAVQTFRHVLSLNPAFTAARTQLEQLSALHAGGDPAGTSVVLQSTVVPAVTPEPVADVHAFTGGMPASPAEESIEAGSAVMESPAELDWFTGAQASNSTAWDPSSSISTTWQPEPAPEQQTVTGRQEADPGPAPVPAPQQAQGTSDQHYVHTVQPDEPQWQDLATLALTMQTEMLCLELTQHEAVAPSVSQALNQEAFAAVPVPGTPVPEPWVFPRTWHEVVPWQAEEAQWAVLIAWVGELADDICARGLADAEHGTFAAGGGPEAERAANPLTPPMPRPVRPVLAATLQEAATDATTQSQEAPAAQAGQ